MGDRAVIYVKDSACALYLHWGGREVRKLLKKAAPTMRRDDPDYAQARLIGAACAMSPGITGIGVLPPPESLPPSDDYSHGGAGVFVVDCKTGIVETFHGYGFDGEDAPVLTLGND